MPGKQMSIDADLNAGLIDDKEARKRRDDISREAEFYGAMDGAIRFTSRDAIASILILTINIIGGFLIGVLQFDMDFAEAARRFTILTIGDGLVTTIPSLLISVAGGIITTRAASESSLGEEVASQLFSTRSAVAISFRFSFHFRYDPGPARPPFFILSALAGFIAYKRSRSLKQEQLVIDRNRNSGRGGQAQGKDRGSPEGRPSGSGGRLRADPLRRCKPGRDFLSRIKSLRRQIALDLGFVVPPCTSPTTCS